MRDQRNLWYFGFFLRVPQNSLICIISLSYFVLKVHILHLRYHYVHFSFMLSFVCDVIAIKADNKKSNLSAFFRLKKDE